MKLLYSDILPLGTYEDQVTISDRIHSEIQNADKVEVAVGYVSKASLEELDELVSENNIENIKLLIGMYYVEGMPEGSYHTAMALNEKWRATGIGEIRVAKAFKYHGKLYSFYKDDLIKSSIVGSANLGVIKMEANNRRQYEVSAITTDAQECSEIATLIAKLMADNCSSNIADITDMPIIREINTSLTGVDTVEQITQTEVNIYERHKTDISFVLPIKVPRFAERHMDDNRHFTKSNLNVSYAAPRQAQKNGYQRLSD